MAQVRQPVQLLEKNKPQQARAKRTYEGILAAAAQLLVEVGVERISTNLVAQRAAITVPAVYRYFPNKYALLNVLGARLMSRQNAVFQKWFEQLIEANDPQFLLGGVYAPLERSYTAIYEQEGALELMRALQAIGPIQGVRLASHQWVADSLATTVAHLLGKAEDEQLKTQAHLSMGISYAVVDMALEAGAPTAESILREGAAMIQRYWQAVIAAQ